MEAIVLVFEAPLMSFGGVLVDQLGRTENCPGLSLITGLLGNALGWDHADASKLEALQKRLRVASRCDHPGEPLVDYHTVDLGDRAETYAAVRGPAHEAGSARPLMAIGGWTTRGAREDRRGGEGSTGTHIRYRHYHADRVQTVALTLVPPEGTPTLDELECALRRPARPLFLGRKTCLPSRPVLAGHTSAPTLHAALNAWPRHRRAKAGPLQAWWPAEEKTESNETENSVELPAVDRRDWVNQLVAGRRLIRHGHVSPPSGPRNKEEVNP
jgi:CRISPR system Cascade subunit CasD